MIDLNEIADECDRLIFNENDKYCAQWLRNLYPDAVVDDRSIKDVQPADLVGYERVHLFGGIGGWEYACELAGWQRPIWTGSCPCQPFSAAGKRKGTADERHLWPEMFRLIRECRPPVCVGEQVASKDGLGWLDGVFADLEGAGYSCGAADLCAASVGAPDIRQRLFWVGFAGGNGQRGERSQERRAPEAGGTGKIGGMAHPVPERLEAGAGAGAGGDKKLDGTGEGLGNTTERGRTNAWQGGFIIACRDGKGRRVSTEPGDEPLAYGIPRDVGQRFPELAGLAKGARRNRVGRLRGYGNAICPIVAAEFLRAVMDVL